MKCSFLMTLIALALCATTALAQQPAPQYYPQPQAQPQPAPPPGYAPQPVPAQQPAPQPAPPPGYAQPAPAPAPQPAPPPGYAQPAPPPPGYAQPAPQPPPPGYEQQPQQPQYAPFPQPVPLEPPPVLGAIPDGAVQLGLGTFIVRYEGYGTEADNNFETDVSRLAWGLQGPLALEIGFGLSQNIVLGGMLLVGGNGETTEPMGGQEADRSRFQFEIGPKLDFMFSPGATVNPFIGAVILAHIENEDLFGTETSVTMFFFEARGGLRAFLMDQVSLDPSVLFGFGVGSGSQDQGGGEADFDISGFQVGLHLGLSVWLR